MGMNEENIITIVNAITGETIVRELTAEEIAALPQPALSGDAAATVTINTI